jgi:hypothetical protein
MIWPHPIAQNLGFQAGIYKNLKRKDQSAISYRESRSPRSPLEGGLISDQLSLYGYYNLLDKNLKNIMLVMEKIPQI